MSLNMTCFFWKSSLSGTRLKILERHKNSVRVNLSPWESDEKLSVPTVDQAVDLRYPLALTGSRDKTALLWDLESGVAIRELKHSTDVRSVFLNNRILITTDELKDIYLWDLEIPCESNYQRQRNTCIRSLTGDYVLFCKLFNEMSNNF